MVIASKPYHRVQTDMQRNVKHLSGVLFQYWCYHCYLKILYVYYSIKQERKCTNVLQAKIFSIRNKTRVKNAHFK